MRVHHRVRGSHNRCMLGRQILPPAKQQDIACAEVSRIDRQQVPRGVAGLGQGSADLFRRVREDLDPDVSRFLGLNVERLHSFALELAEQPERDPGPPDAPAVRVLSLVLRPNGEALDPAANDAQSANATIRLTSPFWTTEPQAKQTVQ